MEAINDIEEYQKQYTYEDLKNSKFVFYGFTKFVEVIGEAVYMLTKEFREEHPEVRNTRTIEVHTMSVEEFNKQYPTKCEIVMSPLPNGYVAKLASIFSGWNYRNRG